MTPGTLIDHQPTSVQLHRRIRNHKLNRLPISQRAAESGAHLGIFDHHIQGAAGDAHRTRAVAANASLLYPALRDRKALALAADDVRGRHAHIFEENLSRRVAHHRWPQALQRNAWRLHIDDETGYAATRAFFRIGHSYHLSVIRRFGAGDETFGAIDNVVIAILDGAGFHACRIAAGVRFGLREANALFAAYHRVKKTFLLFLITMKQHRSDFRAKDRRIAKRNRNRARDLFHDDATAHQIEARAAVLRRHVQQPKTDSLGFLLERFDVLFRHVLALGPALALQRNQLSIDEFANGFF